MKKNMKQFTGTALLAALIVVLQTVAVGIKFGTFTPTLSLIPIVVGAILYGPLAGGFLGMVFGIIVVIGVLSGHEAMSTLMFQAHPFITVALCLFKGIMAGVVPGVVYGLLKDKGEIPATAVSSILAPFMNTGIFCLGLVVFFRQIALDFAEALGFGNIGNFVIVGIVGGNFLFELALNAVLIPVIIKVIKSIRR